MKTSHTRRGCILFVVSLLTLVLDQFSKYWMLNEVGIVLRSPIVVTDFFSLVMLWNRGVSFGMFSHSNTDWAPYFLIGVAVVISLILARMAIKSPKKWERFSYGLVIGGALANALDRIRFGAVADFFYFHIGDLGYPAFNVADSAICVGVAILLITMVRSSKVSA